MIAVDCSCTCVGASERKRRCPHRARSVGDTVKETNGEKGEKRIDSEMTHTSEKGIR